MSKRQVHQVCVEVGCTAKRVSFGRCRQHCDQLRATAEYARLKAMSWSARAQSNFGVGEPDKPKQMQTEPQKWQWEGDEEALAAMCGGD